MRGESVCVRGDGTALSPFCGHPASVAVIVSTYLIVQVTSAQAIARMPRLRSLP